MATLKSSHAFAIACILVIAGCSDDVGWTPPPASISVGESRETRLLEAIERDDLDCVVRMLDKSLELAHVGGYKSPLRVAAKEGRLEICRHLTEEHQVDIDDFHYGLGRPVIASAFDHPEVVRLLIDSGADLETPITIGGNRSGIWLIKDGATLLHYAARDGVPESISMLINAGVDVHASTLECVEHGLTQTPLEIAARYAQIENARAILEHPTYATEEEETRLADLDKCLLIAARDRGIWRRPEDVDWPRMIALLLEHGANPNTNLERVVAEGGVTPVQALASEVHPTTPLENRRIKQAVSLLVSHGASLDLFSAVAIGDERRVDEFLAEQPGSANARSYEGYPALHMAVAMDDGDMVAKLLNALADGEIRDTDDHRDNAGRTALHRAVSWRRHEIARQLIDAGVNVNANANDRTTPLHVAAERADVQMVQLLLDHGANPDAEDCDGNSPADVSRQSRDNKSGAAREVRRMIKEQRRSQDRQSPVRNE